jgi:signal transduction histidine kinase
MNRLPGIGLKGEIALNLFLFVAMIIVMMAFLLFDVSREEVVVQRIEDRRGLVESILSNLEGRARSDSDLSTLIREGSLREHLVSCRDGGLFSEARVFDPSGTNLLWIGDEDKFVPEENRALDAKRAMDDRRFVLSIHKNDRKLFKDVWGEVIISAPVRLGNEVVGGVQFVSHMTQPKDGILNYNWQLLVLLIFFSLAMVVVISYSLGLEVVKPIGEILKATERVREGDLEQTLTPKSRNEIGKLCRSFNEMVKQLRDNQNKVSRYVESLKEANQKLQKAEHHMLRTEKLATIGRLAAGVAHEVGNPLGSLYGYLEVLRKKITGEYERDLIGKIEKETNRINEIIFGLLDLAKQGKGSKEVVNINELIEKTVSLLSSQNALTGIGSQLHLKLDLPQVKGDPREIQQVLIHIIVNAIEAMPSGGVLTIRSDTMIYPQDERCGEIEPVRREGDPLNLDYSHLRRKRGGDADMSLVKGQEMVFVEISDTGRGIKREQVSKIFEPFFTLKDRDRERGTGLGLAICERIIRGMGGVIRVQSIWGKGSKFTFYLPLVMDKAGDSSETAGLGNENQDHRGES